MVKLALDELRTRARRLRVVLSDVDGVHTDGGVYYSDSGESFKRFSVRDGMGVERLRNAGIATMFVTRERSESVRKRAEKLQMPHVYLGIFDKAAALETILEENSVGIENVAYIGDDVNDLAILGRVAPSGLTGAPQDAMPQVCEAVHFQSAAKGGYGAFRDFAEWLLDLRGSSSD